MILSKRDIREVKINLAKIYDGLKEVCDLYGLDLEFIEENFSNYLSGIRISQVYKTKITITTPGFYGKRYDNYNSIIIEFIKVMKHGRIDKYQVRFTDYVYYSNSGYCFEIYDFKDLPVLFLEKFQNLEVLTGDEAIIKDIIE